MCVCEIRSVAFVYLCQAPGLITFTPFDLLAKHWRASARNIADIFEFERVLLRERSVYGVLLRHSSFRTPALNTQFRVFFVVAILLVRLCILSAPFISSVAIIVIGYYAGSA